MLGHAKIETTQIYTRISIGALQNVYARTHPSAHSADILPLQPEPTTTTLDAPQLSMFEDAKAS